MGLMDFREPLLPYEYEQAIDYWQRHELAHWSHLEVSMARDIQDWNFNLKPNEKHTIGSILKSFAQIETVVNNYWTTKIPAWFPKHEVCMMSSSFGGREGVHTQGYNYLNESLNLVDFQAFLQDPNTRAKLDNLIETKGKTKKDIARSLAIFSAFTEGVQLFSSFAILMIFSLDDRLKGVGEIVAWSVKDESLHSEAGCWLFRQFIAENPDIWTDDLKKDIYDAARMAVSLEDDFIDKAFEQGPIVFDKPAEVLKQTITGLTADELKNYVRMRANTKLHDLGLKSNWKNIDKEKADKVGLWFDFLTAGQSKQDFFAGRVVEYSKGTVNFDNIFEDFDNAPKQGTD